jgi:hypothetical protein
VVFGSWPVFHVKQLKDTKAALDALSKSPTEYFSRVPYLEIALPHLLVWIPRVPFLGWQCPVITHRATRELIGRPSGRSTAASGCFRHHAIPRGSALSGEVSEQGRHFRSHRGGHIQERDTP